MRWFLGCSLLLLLVLPGCGGRDDGDACVANQTMDCICVNGLSGFQVCNAEGSGFKTECQCPSVNDTTSSDVTSSDTTTPAQDTTTPLTDAINPIDGDVTGNPNQNDSFCVENEPLCGERVCGLNAFHGRCGTCPLWHDCNLVSGKCISLNNSSPDSDSSSDSDNSPGSDSSPGSDTASSDWDTASSDPGTASVPGQCSGAECGPGGYPPACGECSGATPFCDENGNCIAVEECVPDCSEKQCGSDGCGGSCGECANSILCTSSGTCITSSSNLGFECGNLADWSFEGNAMVVKNLGASVPPEGDYMLELRGSSYFYKIYEENSGVLPPVLPVVAVKQVNVPASVSKLQFQWRFFSEEFLTFCGSKYQDYFLVRVKRIAGPDWEEATFMRTINDLCPIDKCFSCGAEYVGLEPSDVHFDVGDAYMTPWLTSEISLEGLVKEEGSLLEIRIETGISADDPFPIYVTTVLIDSIKFLD